MTPDPDPAVVTWRAFCYITELIALHRVRGPLSPMTEVVVREATRFVETDGRDGLSPKEPFHAKHKNVRESVAK